MLVQALRPLSSSDCCRHNPTIIYGQFAGPVDAGLRCHADIADGPMAYCAPFERNKFMYAQRWWHPNCRVSGRDAWVPLQPAEWRPRIHNIHVPAAHAARPAGFTHAHARQPAAGAYFLRNLALLSGNRLISCDVCGSSIALMAVHVCAGFRLLLLKVEVHACGS